MAKKKETTSKGVIKGLLSKAWDKVKGKPRSERGTKAEVEAKERARIAEKTGRSAKQIADIEKGKRPGRNLLDSLKGIFRGRKVKAPPKEEKKVKARKKTPEEIEAERKRAEAEAERKRAEEAAAARRAELEAVAAGGMTVTVKGKMGTSKDFRNRIISADLEPDDALEFLTMWDVDRDAALEFFFAVGYGAPLSVERLDGITFS